MLLSSYQPGSTNDANRDTAAARQAGSLPEPSNAVELAANPLDGSGTGVSAGNRETGSELSESLTKGEAMDR